MRPPISEINTERGREGQNALMKIYSHDQLARLCSLLALDGRVYGIYIRVYNQGEVKEEGGRNIKTSVFKTEKAKYSSVKNKSLRAP